MIKLKFNDIEYNEWLSSNNVIIDDRIYHKCKVNKKILYLYCTYFNFKKNNEYTYNIIFNIHKTETPDIYVIKYYNEKHIDNRIFRYGKSILINDVLYIFENRDNLFLLERLKKLKKIKENIS